MTAGQWTGESTYQTWVVTLRRWSANPSTSLTALPPLDETTFTPNTYDLLFKHLTAAIQSVMDQWNTKLQKMWDENPDDFTIGQRMVELRVYLRRRVELCGHPSLPERVRDQLTSQTRTDIERIQRELEDSVRRLPQRGAATQSQADALLGVVRENSFVGVLNGPAEAPEKPKPGRIAQMTGRGRSKQPPRPPKRGRRIVDPSLISE